MEHFSSIERVAGKIPEIHKEQILRNKGERFDDQAFVELEGKEREKTPEELQIISLANEATNEILQRYGLENFDIPPKNIHVIAEEAWFRGEKNAAFYAAMLQGVAMREQPAKVVFLEKVFHEMLHFKSYNALQVTKSESPELADYRVGLTVHTREGNEKYFVNLNEAVTEEMTKKFITKLFDNPLFAKETKQTNKIIKKYPRAITASGEPLFDDDTFYAATVGKKFWGESVGRLFGVQEKPTKLTTHSFTYQTERKILNILLGKILERNPEKFDDREKVFEVFAKGMMTGNILPVGRLIEETFGNGTLRRIGELDSDIEAQEAFVTSL